MDGKADVDPSLEKDSKLSYFALFDGHAGEKCCNFLRDNLHLLITQNEQFFKERLKGIRNGILEAEEKFLQLVINDASVSDEKKANLRQRSSSLPAINPKCSEGTPRVQKSDFLDKAFDQSGSCLSLVFIDHDRLQVANVGDSRVILGYSDFAR